MPKQRIDTLLFERKLVNTLEHANALLMAGKVFVNQQLVTTPGTQVDLDAEITLKQEMPYVSRGGYKLEAALRNFDVDPGQVICADVGASTGGFTDVLLQHGAKKVYALDVGYGILAWKLRQDSRVVVMERTNARKVESLPESVSLIVVDVSFISLKLILPAAKKWASPEADFIVLVKPQFEAKKEQVERGGIVSNRAVQIEVLTELMAWCKAIGLTVVNLIASPLKRPAKNQEFLMHLVTKRSNVPQPASVLIERCFRTLYLDNARNYGESKI